MKITGLRAQIRDPQRINVHIDGVYRFSLDITQIIDEGMKVGSEYNQEAIDRLEQESIFGKLYTRALEYALTRPRSKREMQEYLYRKTMARRIKTGALKEGVPVSVTHRVLERLIEKRYVDDESFARYWAENRNLRKGMSTRKLTAELRAKGVESSVIDSVLGASERSDTEEIEKIIAKKRYRYDDERKFIAYLMQQGFTYDDVRDALSKKEES